MSLFNEFNDMFKLFVLACLFSQNRSHFWVIRAWFRELFMSSPVQWYLAQLKPNGFDRAVINLKRQGFEAFMPVRDMIVRRGRAKQICKRPLFPGYIFVGVDRAAPQWSVINNTLGISSLVSFGSNEPTPLPDGLMAGLMARCGDEDVLLPPDDLKIGDHIRAVSGPFADYLATIETIPNEKRLGILFEFMGQKKRAIIHINDIEKISK